MSKRTKSEKELIEIIFLFFDFFLLHCLCMAYIHFVNACVWEPKEDFECPSLSQLTLLYWESLYLTWGQIDSHQALPRLRMSFTVLGWPAHTAMLSFLCRGWDLNSNPHLRAASTLTHWGIPLSSWVWDFKLKLWTQIPGSWMLYSGTQCFKPS